ncbi:enoyl-CoA hydratase/isomerase family protein [Bacillaceae bacterium W0354]
MTESVLFDILDEQIGVLMINRPAKRNAISRDVVEKLEEIISNIYDNEAIKCLIITGKGEQAFCSGGDLNDFHGEMNEREAYQLLRPMKDVLFKIATLPFPTVAWMNGSARGGGLELASSCDFRFANQSSTYGFVQGKLGITTGWGGGTLLYHRINQLEAFYWMIQANVRSAEELKEIGFIQGLIDDINIKQSTILKAFKNRSVEQMRIWKKQYLNQISIEKLALDMEEEVVNCSKLWESEAHKKAVKQFFEKNN